MIPTWMQHIELVVLASLIVLIVSSFVNSIVSCGIQRWILHSDCTTCIASKEIPGILSRQAILREETIKKLEVTMAEIKGELRHIRELLEEKRAYHRQGNGES